MNTDGTFMKPSPWADNPHEYIEELEALVLAWEPLATSLEALVLEWQAHTDAATAHFGHYDEQWTKEHRRLLAKTHKTLYGKEGPEQP